MKPRPNFMIQRILSGIALSALSLATGACLVDTAPVIEDDLLPLYSLNQLAGDSGTAGGAVSNLHGCESVSGGKCMYVSQLTYTGNLGGIAGADTLCNDKSGGTMPSDLNGTYKAFLVDAALNRNGQNGSQVDWVLTGGTSYYLYPTVTLLGTAAGDNTMTSLTNSFGMAGSFYFTGMNNDMSPKIATFTCNSWTNATPGNNGERGDLNSTSVTYINDNSSLTCDNAHAIVCVQQ